MSSCVTCAEAKQPRASFPPSPSRATKPLEIVHMDTMGPMQTTGHEGVLYAVPVLDDYSSYTAMVFAQSKDQIAEKVVDLLTYLQRQAGFKVLCIRSDHGTDSRVPLPYGASAMASTARTALCTHPSKTAEQSVPTETKLRVHVLSSFNAIVQRSSGHTPWTQKHMSRIGFPQPGAPCPCYR